METKTCTRCGQEKSTMDFTRNKSRKDGLQSQCRECRKQLRREEPTYKRKSCPHCGMPCQPRELVDRDT